MIFALPLLALVFGISEQISQEHTVKKFGLSLQVFVKFLITTIFTYIVDVVYKLITIGTGDLSKVFFDFRLVFSFEALGFLALFLTAHIVCVVLFNKILKDKAIYLLNILMKISMVFILGIEILLGNLEFSFQVILAILIFLLGVLFVLNVFSGKKIDFKQDKTTIIIIVVLVLLNIAYPYLQQHLLNENYINKETMLILSSFLTSFYGLIFLKPDLSKVKETLKPYTFQCFGYVISQLVLMEILKKSMTMFMFVSGIMGVGITLFSAIILKQKINKWQYLGVVLTMIGFVYMQILLNG